VEPEQLVAEGKQFLARLDQPRWAHSVTAVMQQLAKFPTASVAGLASQTSEVRGHLQIESVERYRGDSGRVRDEFQNILQDHHVFVVSQTAAEAERLRAILATAPGSAAGNLHFPTGRLQTGFHLVRDSVIVISGAELFHRADFRRTPRRHTGKAIDSFLDLREGDLVVHLSHGIGRYRGLQLLHKDDRVQEHLEVEFDGGTKVYVPASRIELVQKYVGGRKARPRLARIGGKQWTRHKEAAARAVTDLASEMLELPAQRAARPGFALSGDTDWQYEFDAAFPFHETADQLAAI
jgi:transcription-repair coupling factor (superfamily II helicase)